MVDNNEHAPLSEALSEAIADDAEALALLHAQELNAETIAALRATGFPDSLGLLPTEGRATEIWRMMAAAVEQLPASSSPAPLDALAADFAAIYLTGAYGASPCESVWLDDDHLACQQSMFELRVIYQAAGLAATDWRRCPDDHLVLQLSYIAHAARHARQADDWVALARLLDEHLLRWLPSFSRRVANRCEQIFYAALALITEQWCERLRDILAACLDQPRPSTEEVEDRLKPGKLEKPRSVPLTYMPGAAPSW